jgi:hypothetical protein
MAFSDSLFAVRQTGQAVAFGSRSPGRSGNRKAYRRPGRAAACARALFRGTAGEPGAQARVRLKTLARAPERDSISSGRPELTPLRGPQVDHVLRTTDRKMKGINMGLNLGMKSESCRSSAYFQFSWAPLACVPVVRGRLN